MSFSDIFSQLIVSFLCTYIEFLNDINSILIIFSIVFKIVSSNYNQLAPEARGDKSVLSAFEE